MNHKLRTWATWLACALFVFVLAPIVALACETPVYEYTIHMWQRDPYRVWYFHDGGEDPADKPVNDLLDAALDRDANLSFLSVDINKLDDVGYQFQREVYEAHKDQPLPLHVLLTPRGTAMGAERLTVESAKALMDSPKRRQMNELLCEGKQGGMVLLLGENDQANTDARQAVEAAAEEAKADGQDVGVTEVSRDDPAERWHVEQLLNLEDDLHEFDEPMVFGMFGRGHALEPYLGRGITRENLMELVSFMGGPCSCEIKATAPGLDILTQLDWESELENWTSKDPDQLAADTGLGGYVEITIPAVTPEDDPDEPNQTEPVEPDQPAATDPEPAAPASVASDSEPAAVDTPVGGVSTPTPSASSPKPRPARPKPKDARPAEKPAVAPPPSVPAAELDETPGETVAAEQEEEMASRAPNLPEPSPLLQHPDTGPKLSRRLGTILGFGLGGGVLFAAVGGTALFLIRREK